MPAQAALWRTDRYREVLAAVSWLTRQGEVIYSPIVHYHQVALHFIMPTEAEFWRVQNKAMLIPAREIIVLRNLGWENSKGVTDERQWAADLGKPKCFLDEKQNGTFLRTWE